MLLRLDRLLQKPTDLSQHGSSHQYSPSAVLTALRRADSPAGLVTLWHKTNVFTPDSSTRVVYLQSTVIFPRWTSPVRIRSPPAPMFHLTGVRQRATV